MIDSAADVGENSHADNVHSEASVDVQVFLDGAVHKTFHFHHGVSATDVIELCDRYVGHGPGGYIKLNEKVVLGNEVLCTKVAYEYILSEEQILTREEIAEARRIRLDITEANRRKHEADLAALSAQVKVAEARRDVAAAEAMLAEAQLRAVQLDEQTDELRKKRKRKLDDINRVWNLLYQQATKLK